MSRICLSSRSRCDAESNSTSRSPFLTDLPFSMIQRIGVPSIPSPCTSSTSQMISTLFWLSKVPRSVTVIGRSPLRTVKYT